MDKGINQSAPCDCVSISFARHGQQYCREQMESYRNSWLSDQAMGAVDFRRTPSAHGRARLGVIRVKNPEADVGFPLLRKGSHAVTAEVPCQQCKSWMLAPRLGSGGGRRSAPHRSKACQLGVSGAPRAGVRDCR